MKHAILGVGAIGGLIGAALGSLCEDIAVIVRPETLPEFPAKLKLERPTGSLMTPAKAVAALIDPVDVLWIATKTYQMETALAAAQVSPGYIVPLLNGVDHIAVLRARFRTDRVIPATIAVEAEKLAPGRFIQRSPFVRLNLASSGEPVLGTIIQKLGDLGFTCQFMQNEQTLLWSKLCFLAPFALVSSASGMNIGEVLANAVWKEKLNSAIAEACAVGRASGAEIDAQQFEAIFEGVPPSMRSSMQKDLFAGRQLELDAIGGPIVRGGERYGVNVSTTMNLIAVILSKAAAA